MASLRQNTWSLNAWYEQDYAGNVDYTTTVKDGFAWGRNDMGQLGQNEGTNAHKSSPVQVPGTTWATIGLGDRLSVATKTDGTLWAWGKNSSGELGQNNIIEYSSPVQIPGTSWPISKQDISVEGNTVGAIKTDGTLWKWGQNEAGEMGQNLAYAQLNAASSPVQVPGTWGPVTAKRDHAFGLKLL